MDVIAWIGGFNFLLFFLFKAFLESFNEFCFDFKLVKKLLDQNLV
jgi:hypothetical protein